MADKASYSD